MRGPIDDLHPVAAHLLYTFEQTREDLARFTDGLTREQLWFTQHDIASLGFQLKHIAGSVDRLATYLDNRQLSDEQLVFLSREAFPDVDLSHLLKNMEVVFARVTEQVRAIPVSSYLEPRGIGRRQLPTTVAGIIIHLCEHTQRHLGQAILTAKLARALA
jgi:hypothetical protein